MGFWHLVFPTAINTPDNRSCTRPQLPLTYYLLFVMELSTRRVHLAACTRELGDDFMKQIARNLTDPFDGFRNDKKYVLVDRDSNFSSAF